MYSNNHGLCSISSVQLLSRVWLFVTPWITAGQASLSITNTQSLLKLMPIESVMPSSHLILCSPLLILPPIRPSIRVFSSESILCMRWPKYWSFSFSIGRSNEHPGLIFFRMDWLDLLAVCSIVVYIYGKKPTYKWADTVQINAAPWLIILICIYWVIFATQV